MLSNGSWLIGVFRRRALLAVILFAALFSLLYLKTRKVEIVANPYYTSTAKVIVRTNEAPIQLSSLSVIRADESEDPVLEGWFAHPSYPRPFPDTPLS